VTEFKLEPAAHAQLTAAARERLTRLAQWSLDRIASRAADRHGWSPAHTCEVQRAYRQFLVLIALAPDSNYGMADGDVDAMWHEHLIDTVDYLGMCREVFGRMIHHCPVKEGSPSSGEPLYISTTLPALEKVFGQAMARVWPLSASTGGVSKCCNHIGELLAA
jgi:hypothetical protein